MSSGRIKDYGTRTRERTAVLSPDRQGSYWPSIQVVPVGLGLLPGDSSRSRAMLRTTPSLRSGSRCRFAACGASPRSPGVRKERLLVFDVLVERLDALGGGAEDQLLGPQLVEAGFLSADLGLDVVEQGFEEDVLVEPVVVDPEGVVLLRRLEQPIDRSLAAALGIPLHVVVPQKPPAPACGNKLALGVPAPRCLYEEENKDVQ